MYKIIEIGKRKYEVHTNGDVFCCPYVKTDGRKMKRKKMKFSQTGSKHAVGFHAGHSHLKKYITQHRLLAECFIPNPQQKPQVDHIDGDPTNNNLSNLRWVTAKENSRAFNRNQRNSSSMYRVVQKFCNKWRARVIFDRIPHDIGIFQYESSAAIAWNHRAIELGFSKEALNKLF